MTDLTFRTTDAPKSSQSDWKALDPESLPTDIRKLYDAYKDQQAIAKRCKAAFENAMRAAVVAPTGKTLYFGYLYGKLSYAFLDDKPTKAKASVVNFASLAKKA